MKTDVNAFKKQIDSLVFSNESVKALVEKGLINPESTIEKYEWPEGKKKTKIVFKYFDCVLEKTEEYAACNEEDSEYLFGWYSENAVEKVAESAIKTLTWRANPDNKKAIEQAEYDFYSSYYDGNHYNGD